ELVTIVAQGDGLELTHKLHVKPNETNDPAWFLPMTEPRELLCTMMTSKGGQFADWINQLSKGLFYKGNPLGIVHFGQDSVAPAILGSLQPFRAMKDGVDAYGEPGFNIYSANGTGMFTQYMNCLDETEQLNSQPYGQITWGTKAKEVTKDSPSIELYLYDKSVWDIAQTLAMGVPDYIAAVHPFELRSTLFYGRPAWGLAYKYDYLYTYDAEGQSMVRKIGHEYRKPFCQYHMFQGVTDIISNKIRATEANMYTNVTVTYGGKYGDEEKVTPLISADDDIYPEKQSTAIVRADIVPQWDIVGVLGANFWTSERYAQTVGANALRDYMKDMYDGELTIMGYPSIKPYDKFYLEDNYNDMQGMVGVKRVVHHMSFETGFVTNITPDCIAVVDDMQQISLTGWMTSMAGGIATSVLARRAGAKLLRSASNKLFSTEVVKVGIEKAGGDVLKGLASKMLGTSKEARTLMSAMDDAILSSKPFTNVAKAIAGADKNLTGVKNLGNAVRWFASNIDTTYETANGIRKLTVGAKAAKGMKAILGGLDLISGVTGSVVLTIGITVVTESLVEMYRRYLRNRQAVILVPLKYHGKPLTAGINGHRGCVYGDSPGTLDKFLTEDLAWLNTLLFDEDENPTIRQTMMSSDEWFDY
ncbi:MAG: hypothetical protein NWF07_04855, partial [Candidatus Bathyarchaeota archaeon]|nr:hypothetical protein [Candidatus Bathyarchaeota archaeon]